MSSLQTSLPLFPAMGLQTPGEVVEANFGEAPFVFDFEGMLTVSTWYKVQSSSLDINL